MTINEFCAKHGTDRVDVYTAIKMTGTQREGEIRQRGPRTPVYSEAALARAMAQFYVARRDNLLERARKWAEKADGMEAVANGTD